MRYSLATAASLAAIAFAGSASAEGVLHIYNWGDYTNPALIEKFEKEYNIDVTLDDYDSNETMLAKVRAGNSGYDIVVPTDYILKVMIDDGLLEEVRPDQLENFKNVDPQWVDVYFDEGRHYSVPWQWGTTSFAVNTDYYKGDINTLAILFDPPPELQGKINMQPSPDEVFNAASRYIGIDICDSDPANLKKLYETVKNAKVHWLSMNYDSDTPMNSGGAAVTQTWNGAAMRLRLTNPAIVYAYPREGYSVWMDNVAVLKGAANAENAKLFMNFIMDPENAALISDYAKYANGILGSEEFLPADFGEAPEIKVPEEAQDKGTFVTACPQDVVEKHNQLWANLMK